MNYRIFGSIEKISFDGNPKIQKLMVFVVLPQPILLMPRILFRWGEEINCLNNKLECYIRHKKLIMHYISSLI